MFSKKEKWIQICIFFVALLGVLLERPSPWLLSDKVLSVFPNHKNYALELLCIYLFMCVPLVLHPTNICFLCELFLIWNISLWTSTWDQKFSFLISLWGPTSLVEWIWNQRGNWERQDILLWCHARLYFILYAWFFYYFCIWTASSQHKFLSKTKQNKTSRLVKDMLQLNHVIYRKEYKTLELPDIQRTEILEHESEIIYFGFPPHIHKLR